MDEIWDGNSSKSKVPVVAGMKKWMTTQKRQSGTQKQQTATNKLNNMSLIVTWKDLFNLICEPNRQKILFDVNCWASMWIQLEVQVSIAQCKCIPTQLHILTLKQGTKSSILFTILSSLFFNHLSFYNVKTNTSWP